MNDYTKKVLSKLDIEANGWTDTVNGNIEKYRKGNFRIRLTDKQGNPIKNAEVKLELKNHEYKFGSTTFLCDEFESNPELKELYMERFGKIFNQGVIALYWRDDEPEKGKYRFDKDSGYRYRRPPTDLALEFCEKLNLQPKGHNMIWQNPTIGIPQWARSLSKPELEREIINRIKILAERYADKIPVWDVTNECTAFYNEIMPDNYDSTAWHYATKLFKNNHLIINDYNSFFGHSYTNMASALYYQTQKLRAEGARVDAIGMQCHLFTSPENLPSHGALDINHMYNMLEVYGKLGPVHVSEVTVPSYDGGEYLEMQAKIVENYYKIWFSHPATASIVWWNLANGYAFVNPENPSWNEDYYGGGLLNKDLSKKPAYDVIDRLVNKEWHTAETLVTDENGCANLNGFYGDYQAVIKVGKDETELKLELYKGKTVSEIKL